jgi:predicted dienelactone hydrolase
MCRQALKWVAVATVSVIVAAALGLWLEHRRPIELPLPTGSFAVGRTSDRWDDNLSVWIWYPAAVAGHPDDYLPDAVAASWEHDRPALINFLTRDLSKVRAHSARDVAVSDEQPAYPVVILRGGGSGGAALNYSTLGEDLASHGYVVVGLDITTTGNPELCAGRDDDEDCATRLMGPLIEGIGRALDHLQRLTSEDPRFVGRLDLTRVGVFGHSFGGAQAAQFCSQDTRCKAGVNIDGRPFGSVIRTGIRVPFMFLLSDHGTPDDAVSRRILSQIDAIYARQPRETRMRIAIRGAHHFTFSDDGALLKSRLFRGVLRLFRVFGIDGRRQVQVTAYAVRTFFDGHLKRATAGPVVLTSPLFPEIVLLR